MLPLMRHYALLLTLLFALGLSGQGVAQYVNPFIGTGGHGHTFPGAAYPHGMVQPSPDTRIATWDGCSGYHISDTTISGFAQTHLSGTGIGDLADLLIMPTTGEQDISVLTRDDLHMAYASPFAHESEYAEPGYYRVYLERYGVRAELTASARAAMHRYTFPASTAAGFIIDWDYNNQRGYNHDLRISVISDTEIIGTKRVQNWAKDRHVAFYAKFSKPFTYTLIDADDGALTWDGQRQRACKLLLHFSTLQDEQVTVCTSVSAVDADGARENVHHDLDGKDFDTVRRDAYTAWDTYLSSIKAESADTALLRTFYTALYHTGLQPALASDADGRYRGLDGAVHQADEATYTIFSLWDTMRALHPLLTIIQPALNQQFVRTLLRKADEGGLLPMWELSGNYTGCMIGANAVPVIADAYAKGHRDFDTAAALRHCVRTFTFDRQGIHAPEPIIRDQLMPESKRWLGTLGYAPCDTEHESVAKGLEYAYDCWCVATMARAMGDKATAERFDTLATSYRHYWDAQTGFMRGRHKDGTWRTPFSPIASNHQSDDYCEGNAWQWTWFVPHDIKGLQSLMGGKRKFVARLDSLFTMSSALEGHNISADISGLIGQYAHGNEPSHHVAYLYNYAGAPEKTQALCDSILRTLYADAPDGLTGNEDCGQMSAWYVLSAMGFYQVCPGNPTYTIGSPRFDTIAIPQSGGKTFRIITHRAGKAAKYIRRMTLDGKPLRRPFFTHSDIQRGATLELWMAE